MACPTNRLIAYSAKHQPRIAKGQHAAFSIQAQLVELNLDLGDLRNKDRKSTRLNSSHLRLSRMPSSA